VAFFFKQHGGRTHAEGGCLIDGLEVKEFPKPRLRWSSPVPETTVRRCEATGKRRYASKKAARRVLSLHRGSWATLHCYRCPQCHGWHNGHRDERGRYGWR
jgi:hypothetical protein